MSSLPTITTLIKMSNIIKVSERVERILKENIRARNDDKWLCYLVLQEIAKENGQNIFIPFELFKEFPSFESITRCRRHIQHDLKLYKAEEETERNRDAQTEEIIDYIHNY